MPSVKPREGAQAMSGEGETALTSLLFKQSKQPSVPGIATPVPRVPRSVIAQITLVLPHSYSAVPTCYEKYYCMQHVGKIVIIITTTLIISETCYPKRACGWASGALRTP